MLFFKDLEEETTFTWTHISEPRVQRIGLHMRRKRIPPDGTKFPQIVGKTVMNNASQGWLHVPLQLHKIILGAPQNKFKGPKLCIYVYIPIFL